VSTAEILPVAVESQLTSSSIIPQSTTQAMRPKLRVQTSVHADKIPSVVPLQIPLKSTRLSKRAQPIVRRSSLDSLTTRSTTLLYPDQALSPFVRKKTKIRHKQHPAVLSYSLTSSRDNSSRKSQIAGSTLRPGFPKSRTSPLMLDAANSGDYVEELSPMEFKSPVGSGEDDDDYLDDGDSTVRPRSRRGKRLIIWLSSYR
jgi:hypothetical protein